MRLPFIAFFLILYIAYIPTATARHKYIFSIDNKLPPFKSDDQCKSLRVIDARTNKENLGLLRLGEFDGLQGVITEQSIDTFLQELYNKMKVDAKTNNDELVMVLYKFEMYDKPSQLGTLCFSADFFRGNNGQYKLLACVDSLYEVQASGSVTYVLLEEIRHKLPSILAYYTAQKQAANNNIYTLEQAANKRNDEKRSHPIYATTQFEKGIYYTIDDFLNNSPIDTPLVLWSYLRQTGKHYSFYYKDQQGKRGDIVDATSFFAVCDGEHWWLNDTTTVRKLEYIDGDFYTTKYFKQAHKGSTGDNITLIGVLGGGILGGLIAASVSDAVNADKIVTSRALYKARFNPATKQFVPVARAKK